MFHYNFSSYQFIYITATIALLAWGYASYVVAYDEGTQKCVGQYGLLETRYMFI